MKNHWQQRQVREKDENFKKFVHFSADNFAKVFIKSLLQADGKMFNSCLNKSLILNA